MITVLMPVRHYEPPYLREAVDSIGAQTSPDWRLLIVADGPAPGELAGVLGERCADERIEILRNQSRGLAAALNTGMRAARTEFAAILFADDLWEREAVEVLARNIRAHPEVDFFHSARRWVDGDGHPLSDVHPAAKGVTVRAFGPASPVCHLMCWRVAKALSFGGMDESLNSVGPDDYDFPWTMAEHGAVFRDVPECLYVIRDHRAHFRLTTHLPRSVHVREIRRIQRKHGISRIATERFVMSARRSYLRQCLYRSRLDRFVKERLRIGKPRIWFEPVAADRVHLVEVGLAWPPDTFLRDKLTALARRGLKVTVLVTPGSSRAPSLPGVETREMARITPPVYRGIPTAIRDFGRLCAQRPGLVPGAIRILAGVGRTRGPRSVLGWTSILRDAAEVHPHVIHFEWESSAVRYLPLVDFWRCPMVMSCQGGLRLYAGSPTHAPALEGFRDAFARAAAVHCVSEAIRDEAIELGLDPAKAIVIRPGVDTSIFAPTGAAIEQLRVA